jgi:Serine/threonine protein phosphatase 2A, regulatory subunit
MESFISSDDLRINLWNLAVNDVSYNIVDIKPPNMDELNEVITCAEFNPISSSQFAYSTSKGSVRLSDLRMSALCDTPIRAFYEEEDPSTKSFFSEIISSISDIKFTRDGKYILARDYLTLKVAISIVFLVSIYLQIWDTAMDKAPVKVFNIHEHLRSKLCDLYENDCIFDKFECDSSSDGKQFVTGSYHRYLRVFNADPSTNEVVLQANRLQPKPVKKAGDKQGRKKDKKDVFEEVNPDNIDYTKKTTHLAFHPDDNLIAASVQNNLFIFT